VTRYTSATDADRSEMLQAIGVGSIDELFAEIPAGLRLNRPLALDPGRSEQEVFEELKALAAKSTSAEDEISFLGAGMYDHYVPALIDSIILRSEFLTPYTPYQPEISQGGLQAMFEYQTAISELTGLPVSNASVYEGPSAVGAAAYVAKLTVPALTKVKRRAHTVTWAPAPFVVALLTLIAFASPLLAVAGFLAIIVVYVLPLARLVLLGQRWRIMAATRPKTGR